MKQCPRCGQWNRTHSLKCFRCGYMFSKHPVLNKQKHANLKKNSSDSFINNSESASYSTSHVSVNLSNSSVHSAYISYYNKHPSQKPPFNELDSSTNTSNKYADSKKNNNVSSINNNSKSTSYSTSHVSINLSNSSVHSAYIYYLKKHLHQIPQSNRKSPLTNSYTYTSDNKSDFSVIKKRPSDDIRKKLKYIINLQNYNIPTITVKHCGSSTELDNNKNRLLQCYETYHNTYKEPSLYKLIRHYSFPDFIRKFKLINEMSSSLNLRIPKLQAPKWLRYYSYQFSNYIKQVKGAKGEDWSCNDLRRHKCYDYAHNINIPFNYIEYYRNAVKNDHRNYHKYDYYQYKYRMEYTPYKTKEYNKLGNLKNKYYNILKYHKNCYKYSLEDHAYNNSNQIDILYINPYGIYVYEVKNYNQQTMWINKNGEIKWKRLKPSHGQKYGGQDAWYNPGTLTINQQIKLHKAAIMSSLRKSGMFSPSKLNKIYDNLYGILVYIKSPRKNVGVYRYDHSARDYSQEHKIIPESQNQCFKAIRDKGKQYTFNPDEIKAIKYNILPKYEKAFKLPIFKRGDFGTFKLVYKYKKILNYIYKVLRHDCYKNRILKKIDPSVYRYFKYEQHYQIKRIKSLKKYVNIWGKRLNKYTHSKKVKHYKKMYLRKLQLARKSYNKFYKIQI